MSQKTCKRNNVVYSIIHHNHLYTNRQKKNDETNE